MFCFVLCLNSGTARQVLELAEERYRLGAGSFLDIATARAQFAQAELARVAAVFDFHRAFAAFAARQTPKFEGN